MSNEDGAVFFFALCTVRLLENESRFQMQTRVLEELVSQLRQDIAQNTTAFKVYAASPMLKMGLETLHILSHALPLRSKSKHCKETIPRRWTNSRVI